MSRRLYHAQGVLAMHPRALTMPLPESYDPPANVTAGPATVVEIRGPLDHHGSKECDSYDAIHARVAAACAAAPSIVLLKVDSPGGDVSGCFDTAREIKAMVADAGKRLVAYVDGQACSAAYALVSAAEEVVVPETGCVGSIGVIATRLDLTVLDAAMGQRFAVITSGARKADGNPHVAVSDAELAEAQATVDSLAGVFFGLVKELRNVDAAPLQARVFHGAAAVAAGLADRVASFDQMIKALSLPAPSAQKEQQPMASKFEEAMAALKAAAEGEDEDAAQARKALAAMSDEEPDGDEEKVESDETPKDEPDGDEEKAAASSTVASLAAQVTALAGALSELSAGKESAERAVFLASRPDLPATLIKVLESKPLTEVKAIVAALPRKRTIVPAAPVAPAATAQATASTGTAPEIDALNAPLSEDEEMDRAMGLKSAHKGIRRIGASVEYGVISKIDARKRLEGKV